MKLNKKLVIGFFGSICTMLVASLSLSLAWINSQSNKIDGSEITGRILAQYFDKSASADSTAAPGTENNPFVITRPQHWENLVKLHHSEFWNNTDATYEDFCKQDYFFEVGKVLTTAEGGNGTDYYVYSYDDHGVYNGTASQNLNLGGLSTLEPIGTEEHPFESTLIGHDITVSNFAISADAFEDDANYDLGIFGYAGPEAAVRNIYFSDFEIDVSSLDASGAVERENHANHVNKCYTGYLCGHVYDVDSFQHVYLNKCEITGTSNSYYTVNNYGYFGFVEKDNQGADAGTGGNYKFDLNCSAVYNYLDTYYDDNATYRPTGEHDLIGLKDTSMRVRNTEYDSTINNSNTSFTQGIVKEDGDYRLVGDYYSSGTHNSDRNYSFSTLGYYGTHVYEDVHKYETYYQDGSDWLVPDASAVISNYDANHQQNAGCYYYYNGSKWNYYYSENTIDMFDYSFSFTSLSYSVSYWLSHSVSVYLLVDDTIYTGVKNGTNQDELNYTESLGNDRIFNLEIDDFKLSLCKGTHYVALLVLMIDTGILGFSNKVYDWYYGTLSSNKVSGTSFNVTNNISTNNKTINLSGPESQSGQTHKLSFNSFVSCIPDVNLSPNTKTYVLKGKEISAEDNSVSNTYSDLTVKNSSFDYDYELDLVIATCVERKLDEEKPFEDIYISEDPEIKASGYNSRNIDIVGGGITFSTTYLNLSAEQSGGALTVNPSTIGIGNKFYATQYCANSIVLYMKNTPGDNLGNITVNYTTLGAAVGISLKSPSFKKGGGTFYDFSANNFANYTSNDSGTNRQIKIDNLSRTEIQKASYCALDQSGNVTAIFNTSGVLTAGSTANIDTYVVVLGVEMSDSIWAAILGLFTTNTRITSIHFEYKAEEGYSSALGPVDYRDQTSSDNVADSETNGDDITYFNAFTYYYVVKEAGVSYSFIVEYEGTKTYNSISRKWYTLTAVTSAPIDLQICLYRQGYAVRVVCGSTISYCESSQTITCNGGS